VNARDVELRMVIVSAPDVVPICCGGKSSHSGLGTKIGVVSTGSTVPASAIVAG